MMKHLKIELRSELHADQEAPGDFPTAFIDFAGFQLYANAVVLHPVGVANGGQSQVWRVLVTRKSGRQTTFDWKVSILMGRYIELLHQEVREIQDYSAIDMIYDFRVTMKEDGNWYDVCSKCGCGFVSSEEDNADTKVDRAYTGYEDADTEITLCKKCQGKLHLERQNGGEDADVFISTEPEKAQ